MIEARTSRTHPLQIAEVRAGPACGRIGITFCPGKRDMEAMSGAWARDLAVDLDAVAAWGARMVVTLLEPQELVALSVPRLGEEVLARGLDWRHLPIADFSVPTPAFERRWEGEGRDVRALLRAGGDVVVHCKGGLGRAGMIAARLLVELGVDPEQAVRDVRRVRRGAIETSAQAALVRRTVSMETADADGLDVETMRRVGGRLGTNPGDLVEDERGRRYYVKTLESAALARNERLAAALYRLAGAPTLTYVPVRGAERVATLFVDLAKKRASLFDAGERRQARRWLGVHAWTANWDAVGSAGDNQGVVDGVVTTLDVGGALEFRAMGDPKGSAFGTTVGEIDTLRRDPDNPHAIRLFADMTPAELGRAIAVVTRIPDVAIRRVVAEHGGSPRLAEKLVARRADMAARAAALA